MLTVAEGVRFGRIGGRGDRRTRRISGSVDICWINGASSSTNAVVPPADPLQIPRAPWQADVVGTDTTRRVDLSRRSQGHYVATNARGGTITIGTGEDDDFTPVELLLAAMAGCSAVDVDFITSKRAEPEHFDVAASGDKIADEQGNRLTNLALDFDVGFPADDGGERASGVLERSIKQSHDRLCTVGRTVEASTSIDARVVGRSLY